MASDLLSAVSIPPRCQVAVRASPCCGWARADSGRTTGNMIGMPSRIAFPGANALSGLVNRPAARPKAARRSPAPLVGRARPVDRRARFPIRMSWRRGSCSTRQRRPPRQAPDPIGAASTRLPAWRARSLSSTLWRRNPMWPSSPGISLSTARPPNTSIFGCCWRRL